MEIVNGPTIMDIAEAVKGPHRVALAGGAAGRAQSIGGGHASGTNKIEIF